MIKNIIWDFDGTLFDTYPPIVKAMQAGLAIRGFEYSYDKIMGLCKVSMNHCTQVLSDETGIPYDEIDAAFDSLYAEIGLEEQKPFPGVKEILEKIHADGGKNIIITHRRAATMHQLLDMFQLSPYFSGYLTGDDGFPRKPDPAVFFAALQSFQLNPAETLGIGDRALDAQAGQGAGIQTAFYGVPPQGLGCNYEIHDYFEFLKKL